MKPGFAGAASASPGPTDPAPEAPPQAEEDSASPGDVTGRAIAASPLDSPAASNGLPGSLEQRRTYRLQFEGELPGSFSGVAVRSFRARI